MVEDLDPAKVTIIVNILDNNIYRGNVDGKQVEPVKLDCGYHIPGKLEIVDSRIVKKLFDTAMPVLRAARGAEVLIVGPLQRYLEQKCCLDNSHITNFEDPDNATSIAGAIKEVGIHLRNLLHTSRTGKWSHGGKYGGGGGGGGSSSSAMPHSKRGRGNRGGCWSFLKCTLSEEKVTQ